MEINLTEAFEEVLSSNKLKYLKSHDEIDKLSNKTFLGISTSEFGLKKHIFNEISIDDVIIGFEISGGAVIFSKKMFCISNTDTYDLTGFNLLPIENFLDLKIESGSTTFSDHILLNGSRVGSFNRQSKDKWEKICNVLNPCISNYFDKVLKLEKELKRELEDQKQEEARLKEEERLEKLKVKQSNILAELDKDGNGELDVVEVNNDFDTLVKKHQSKITEVDRSYILNFVKISNYQKTKRKNLQSIFNSIGKTKNQQELNNQVSLLKDQIHSYELILFHSLNMVTSLIEDDMFTFYEIYESFDKLEMFNSNHENEVSKRLINIEGGINDLMNSIRQMENNIIGELGYLSYVTQESYSELSHNVNKQLASIDSSIKTNSLLTGINAYQTYKLRQGK